jgi:hypothetical protein
MNWGGSQSAAVPFRFQGDTQNQKLDIQRRNFMSDKKVEGHPAYPGIRGIRMRKVQVAAKPAKSAKPEFDDVPKHLEGLRMRRIVPAEGTNPRFPGIAMRQIKPAEPATQN